MVIFYWLTVSNYNDNVWKVNFLYKVNSVCINPTKDSYIVIELYKSSCYVKVSLLSLSFIDWLIV